MLSLPQFSPAGFPPISAPSTRPMSSTNPPQTQQPDASFTPFGRLPKELRLTIWELVILEPRIVYLQPKRLEFSKPLLHMCQYHPFYHPKAAYMFCSTTPALKIIMTCKEAYEVASKALTTTFSTPSYHPRTLFNYDIDTLYINWGTSKHYAPRFDHTEASLVKFLAVYDTSRIKSRYPPIHGCHEDWLAAITTTFPNLERLTIVAAQVHNDETSTFVAKKAELFHELFTFTFPRVDNTLIKYNLLNMANRLKTGQLSVKRSRLQRLREKRAGGRMLGPMPKIQYQIMVAEALEATFDEKTKVFLKAEAEFQTKFGPGNSGLTFRELVAF